LPLPFVAAFLNLQVVLQSLVFLFYIEQFIWVNFSHAERVFFSCWFFKISTLNQSINKIHSMIYISRYIWVTVIYEYFNSLQMLLKGIKKRGKNFNCLTLCWLIYCSNSLLIMGYLVRSFDQKTHNAHCKIKHFFSHFFLHSNDVLMHCQPMYISLQHKMGDWWSRKKYLLDTKKKQ
jgi:hypothetical protein